MAVKCLPLPDALRATHGEIQAATPEQRRAFYRALLDHWQQNDHYQRHRDFDADDDEGETWW